MPIRVSCPSCGRMGRVPDRAIGRKIQCPACEHRHVLTPEMALPDAPGGPPAPASALAPEDAIPLADDELDVPIAAAAKPAPKPEPVVFLADEPARPTGPGLPMLVPMGAAAAALLMAAGVLLGMRLNRGAPQAEAVAAAAPLNTPPAPPATRPGVALTPPMPPAPTPPPPDAAAGRDPAPADPVPTGGDIPVYLAAQTEDAAPPEPAGETEVGARARAAAAAVAPGDGGGKALSTADIVAESEPSVALIKGKVSSGTGFLVAPGLIATNAHVVDDEFAADLEVLFVSADDRHKAPLHAELLYEDAVRDLAFLAVKTDLKPLRVAGSYTFRKGEDVTVIGSPGMGDGRVLENAISRGVMSTRTRIDNKDFYQLNIAINPGNSGGPVFDSSGRVIGVATLKSTKQEATGFCIPVEDLRGAMAKLAKQTGAEADGVRSRHRVRTAIKAAGSGGALLCLVIDLRRLAGQTNNAEIKEALGKLESLAAELDKDVFPSLSAQGPRIRKDSRIEASLKASSGEMIDNFAKIRRAYSDRWNVDPNELRDWKQAHRRLVTSVWGELNLEVPQGMLTAFEDHATSQPGVITMAPPGLGFYGSRGMIQRPGMIPRPPTMIPRPPSLRDRMGPRRGFR